MNGEDKKFLGDRLLKLEVLFKERWDKHDKRSEIIWEELKKKVEIVVEKVQLLPCDVHAIRFENMESNIGRLWGLVIIVIGVCAGGGGLWWMFK